MRNATPWRGRTAGLVCLFVIVGAACAGDGGASHKAAPTTTKSVEPITSRDEACKKFDDIYGAYQFTNRERTSREIKRVVDGISAGTRSEADAELVQQVLNVRVDSPLSLQGFLTWCVAQGIAAPSLPSNTTAPPPPPPTTRYVPPPPPSVTYDLTGQGTVSVTIRNASGGTEQFETSLPWHLDLGPSGTFGGVSGFVYVSAQLQSSGSVTCTIKKGDQVVQTATSTGQYVIASCSGSV